MDRNKSLVPGSSAGLPTAPGATSPVMRRMTDSLLADARQGGLRQVRFRIGDHVLREPDYRQIFLWAEALRLSPEELLAVLAESRREQSQFHDEYIFVVEDGSLKALVWDLARLPRFPDIWVEGLRIDTLCFVVDYDTELSEALSLAPRARSLRQILFPKFWHSENGIKLRRLCLGGVPSLERLTVNHTALTDLDLSHGGCPDEC